MIAAAHDFVLRLRLLRQPQRARPALVRIGGRSFALSVLAPQLGVVLAAVTLR